MPGKKRDLKSHASLKYDVISVGDATQDTFVKLNDASVQCDIRREICLLCLNYADKIPVVKLDRTIGGNAANNAVGSSRLGLKSAFYSILGDDEVGKQVLRTMKKERVSTEYIQVAGGQETNTSVVISFKGERTILVYHLERHYSLPALQPAKWLYYTSLGRGHEKLHKQIPAYIRKTGAKLAFNPGTYQLREGLEALKSLFKMTDVLFLNKEEAEMLLGEAADVKDLLNKVKMYGPKTVVITDGQHGAYATDGASHWKIPIAPIQEVERTGAGDAFATAFLASLIHGNDVAEALRWGTVNSASVITKIGPQAGLLTKQQMAHWLKTYEHIKAEKM